MFRRYLHMPVYFIPPGDAGGGSTENGAGSGATASGGIEHGPASDDLIAAASASESSSDEGKSSAEATTLEAAFAKAAGAAEEPLVTAGVVKPPPTTGAKGPQDTGGTEETGPVPLVRHKAAVTNARAAGAAEAEAKYAWAKDLNEATVSTAFDVVSDLIKDPKAFAVKLAGEVGLQLWDGKTPPAGATAVTPGAGDPNRPFPKALLRSEDGKGAYTEEQIVEIAAIIKDQLRSEMKGEIKPLLDARTAEEQREQRAAIQAAAQETATSALTEARALPHFQMKDHAGKMIDNPKILANLLAIPAKTRASIGPVAALYQAYNKFLSEDVFPTIGTSAAAQVRTENQRKVAASLSANPADAAGSVPKKEIRGVSGLAKRMEEMAAAMAST